MMSSGNRDFKPALSYLPQDTEYFTGPVYTTQERKEPSYGSAHPASSMLGKDAFKLKAEQSELQSDILTTNYFRNGRGNAHKSPGTFHPKEATPDKDSNRNDPDKQAHFLKLQQDSYNGPDSYLTTTPASFKSPTLPPLGIYQLESSKEDHKAPNAHYQPQKPKEFVTLHRDQHQIPSSTEIQKTFMLNLQPPDPYETYKGHLDGYQSQLPIEIFEPLMSTSQYANMKESMKQPQHTQKTPKPKEALTPPSDTYQLTESEDSYTTPAKILQSPKSKYSFKPPASSYHAVQPEDSLTPRVEFDNHPESEDHLKEYTDAHEPPKLQDTLTQLVETYEHPELKDSYKPQLDRPQHQEKKYVFQGAVESHRPLPAKEVHKPLFLSPEEFYKRPTKSHTPTKDYKKMPSTSESLKELSQHSPQRYASRHIEDIDDDIYLDYNPSKYVHKENSKEAPPPEHIGPHGAPVYLSKPTYAGPIHPPYGIHDFGHPYGVPPPHLRLFPLPLARRQRNKSLLATIISALTCVCSLPFSPSCLPLKC